MKNLNAIDYLDSAGQIAGGYDLAMEIISVVQSSECINGCLKGGSTQLEINDEFSDVDLFCCINKGYAGDICIENIVSRLSSIDMVRRILYQGYFPWFGECYTIFPAELGVRIVDIGFISHKDSVGFFWEPTGEIVFDNSGVIRDGVTRWKRDFGSQYPFATKRPYTKIAIALHKTLKSLDRKHFFNAIDLISQARRPLIYLLRKDLPEKGRFYYGRPERGIEDVFSDDVIARLEKTYPAIHKVSILSAGRIIGQWALEVHERNSRNFDAFEMEAIKEIRELIEGKLLC